MNAISRAAEGGLLGSLMDLGELADGNQVVGSSVEHSQELGSSVLVSTQLEERASECHPGRQVRGVLGQASLADPDRFLAVAGSPVLFRKLRKSNRRRILLNPASKILNPRVIRHALDYRPCSGARSQGMSSSSSSSSSAGLTSTTLPVVDDVPVTSVTLRMTE